MRGGVVSADILLVVILICSCALKGPNAFYNVVFNNDVLELVTLVRCGGGGGRGRM